MIKTHEREKLINAIVFFAENTRHCGKIKLFKLLYLLDFEHFRQTGHTVTGLDYHALKMGPVPMDFFEEWENFEPDMAAAIEICPERVIDYTRQKVVARRTFDDAHFTRREMRIMGDLAQRFCDELADPMIHFTHDERGPWAKIWNNGRGKLQPIPYTLAVSDSDPNAEAILAAAQEVEGMRAAVGCIH